MYFATKLVANKKWNLNRIAEWLEVNSIPESKYVEGMEAEKETLIELYEEYIAMAKELELQEILTEEEIEERKKLKDDVVQLYLIVVYRFLIAYIQN
ncbi:hypothetical protein QWV57_08615 [Geobacillus zalihae]|uniref:Uncharacterized protein n=2 Tax=Anoxybacillaceae TaxID=3120669 RepID=A0A1I0T661_9BACL|nr:MULTISPECIES: hypothetical protein [Geobacillus]QNU18949.1 hypothetical protein IC807_04700 [Geobacillus zalihae]WJQ12216.1 hypothetical protein QT237_09035 [Geobacillus stearothermophilus]WKA48978.1 hypothetical protein QWV57_08615 [Geobacillus zalihae]SFA47221.1 hypothetical protein SAMN05192569_101417 [Parageobacillus thermantarcticus]